MKPYTSGTAALVTTGAGFTAVAVTRTLPSGDVETFSGKLNAARKVTVVNESATVGGFFTVDGKTPIRTPATSITFVGAADLPRFGDITLGLIRDGSNNMEKIYFIVEG